MDTIPFTDFEKVDIRIGTVVKADVPDWSHWVIRMEVDFGPELGTKKCFSGIMKFFTPKDLEGKQFPFVVNLEPRKIGPEGDFSEGMMMAATVPAKTGKEENETPILLSPIKEVPNGTKVR